MNNTNKYFIVENKYDIHVYMNTSILHQCSEGKTYERGFYLNYYEVRLFSIIFNYYPGSRIKLWILC